MRMRLLPALLLPAFALTAAVAQEPRPTPMPRGAATVTLAGKKVVLDFGRPTLKGRPLADLLSKLPEDRVWRAGENQVSTLSTEVPLLIGGKTVPAGKYTLYVYLPTDGSRHLLLNTDAGVPLGKIWDKAPANLKDAPWPQSSYKATIADKEVLRAPMKKEAVTAPVETFTVDLTPTKDGASMKFSWGDESWAIELKPVK